MNAHAATTPSAPDDLLGPNPPPRTSTWKRAEDTAGSDPAPSPRYPAVRSLPPVEGRVAAGEQRARRVFSVAIAATMRMPPLSGSLDHARTPPTHTAWTNVLNVATRSDPR